METAPSLFTTSKLDPEDQARADIYALLSKLYSAAPDASLLFEIASAHEIAVDGARGDFAQAWQALVAASAAMDPEAAAAEYQELFVGVGQSEVSLHGSAYSKAGGGRPLLSQIREALASLGLARRPEATMFEDHLAAVCEAMRVLITGAGHAEPFGIARQREFFETNVGVWVFACCDAIRTSAIANYYRWVAQFTECFMALERDSFAIE